MAEDGKLKIDSMMVMILVSVRCRSKTLYIRRSFRSLWQKSNLQWTDRADGMKEGRKQNRNKSKSWKIGEIKDKEVNMAAGDYDDALVCCVENTIDDRIMDSGASFHATYCKEELESWTLKDVRYIPGLKRRRLISAGQLEEEGYHVGFGDQQWKVTKDSLVVAHGNKRGSLYMVERLRRCYGQIQLVGTYLIYGIPYVPIGLRILEEEWRGKDTSRTLEGSGLDELRYSFGIRKGTGYPKRDITLRIKLMEPGSFKDSGRSDEEYSEDGASSKEGGFETPQSLIQKDEALSSKESVQWKKAIIEEMVSLEKNQTWSLVRISAGKKASQRLWMFRVKEEQDDSKSIVAACALFVGALNDYIYTNNKKQGFSASLGRKKLDVRLKFIPNSVRTDSSTEVMVDDMLVAGSDMAEFNKPKWQLPLVFEMKDRCSEKQVLGYVLTVGVKIVEWESRLQKSITIYTKSSIHLAKNLKNEEPCRDVHQVGDEREVEALSSLNLPSRLLMNEVWHGACSLSRGVQFVTGRADWHGACRLARGVQFGTGRAI
ncbi:retrovirus-related pol polyprotein from transposon TNT 1-94 [Tanacetum coccineum]